MKKIGKIFSKIFGEKKVNKIAEKIVKNLWNLFFCNYSTIFFFFKFFPQFFPILPLSKNMLNVRTLFQCSLTQNIYYYID